MEGKAIEDYSETIMILEFLALPTITDYRTVLVYLLHLVTNPPDSVTQEQRVESVRLLRELHCTCSTTAQLDDSDKVIDRQRCALPIYWFNH